MVNDPMAGVQHVTAGSAFESLGLVHRVRVPSGEGQHPALIMVHGLHGNEDVTWVFSRAVGPEWVILTPRAPIAGENGCRWYNLTEDENRRPVPESFAAGQAALERFVSGALQHYPIDPKRVILLGFSQGSAMVYAYAMAHRPAIAGIVALSGFIARLNEITIPPLDKLPVLILHGTRDETVPISMAQRARDQLQAADALVTYEEADTGHKISAQGMRTLAAWLAARLT